MAEKYTIDEPPKETGAGKYTIEPPKGDGLGRPGGIGMAGDLIDVARGVGDVLVLDPARNIGADVYGLTHGAIPTDADSRAKFYEAREKSLKATEIPKSKTAEAVSEIAGLPGAAIGTVASSIGDMLGQERKAAVAPWSTMGGDALPLALGGASALRGAIRPEAPRPVVEAGKATNRAREFLSERFQTGLYEGGPSAMDVVEEMQKARASGQPLTLLDANNPELRGAVGTVYRQGGGAQGRISDFLDERHKGQVPRSEKLIGEAMGDPSTFTQTERQLREQRSTNARPAFEEAAKGPGLKALETEFQNAWAEAGRAEFQAARELADAENRMTQARGRQDTAGNVYSSSASNSAVREAEAALHQARQTLADAGRQKAGMRDLMDKARLDGTLRPDAVWSPYLDMLRRENPHVSRGLARGWDIERNKAHGAGERANPRDYAIVGFAENGDPIVGSVPNMRLWMVTKEGLDAEIADNIRANKGHPDKMGHSLIELRDGLVTELDRLNPRYAPARSQWQGDSASLSAVEHGGELIKTGKGAWFKSDQEAAEYIARLSPADRDFVKLGLAQELLNRVRRAPDAADKSKRAVNDDITRSRVEMLLGADAGRFLESIEREAVMERSAQGLRGGSPTAQRRAEDIRNDRKRDAAVSLLGNLFHGVTHPWRLIEAARSGSRLRRAMSDTPDLPMNEAIGKIVTDPGLDISPKPGGPILPPISVPPSYMMSPGRAMATGEALEPRPDGPLARLLRRR